MNNDLLRDDFTTFSDLGTAPHLNIRPDEIDVTWTRGGIEREVLLRTNRVGAPDVLLDSGDILTYSSFLASHMMADLRTLANRIRLLSSTQRKRNRREFGNRTVYPYDWYIDSRLKSDVDAGTTERLASDTLKDFVESPPNSDSTEILFVTASAGQGKSVLLQHFNAGQALRYEEERSRALTFYVDAQGRGLSQLNEAIAFQLNELQFLLPHAALNVLVREGLVTLIVDGFDELIGSRGTYDDAFNSLTTFLETLGGRGKLIAAARSSYFTQEYESRMARMDSLALGDVAYELTRMNVLPWSVEEQTAFLERVLGDLRLGDVRSRAVNAGFERAQADDEARLLSRPIFCRDIVLMLAQDDHGAVGADSSSELVRLISDSILEREAREKLLVEGKAVTDAAMLRSYFEELAAEMWQLETRELDRQTAQVVLEVLLDDRGLQGEAAEVIPARIGYLALINDGVRPQTLRFEHEVFFAHFLAAALADGVRQAAPATARILLSKAALDLDAAAEVSGLLLRSGMDLTELAERCSTLAGERHPRQTQIRRNCGALIAAALRKIRSVDTPLVLQSVDFVGEDLSGVTMTSLHLDDVFLSRVNLVGSNWVGATQGSTFVEPLVDPTSTSLRLEGLESTRDISGLRVVEADGGVRTLYDPREVADTLVAVDPAAAGSAATTMEDDRHSDRLRYAVPETSIALVERLCHAYERLNPLGSNHTNYQDVFDSKHWREIRDALLNCELISEVTKSTSGPAQSFYRKHFHPADLLGALVREPNDPSIDRFWRTVAINQ